MKPKLSLIIGSRNDGYMGNFKYRFETVLNYLADNLKELGRLQDVEVVVADWGSKVPLHSVLSLNWGARQIARFVLVPPDIACKLQGDSEFPIVLAQNVAVRRSRAEFIAQTDSDIMFPLDFLATLFELLDGHRDIGVPIDQALIVAKRRHLPWSLVSRNPGIQHLDWFIRHFGSFILADFNKGYECSSTGMMMMHRSLWEECGGYDERLIHWGWMEIDLGLRIMQKYPWFDLLNLGVTVFHLEHYPPISQRHTNRKCNPTVPNKIFSPSGNKWGLSEYVLEIFTYPSQAQKTDLVKSEEQRPVQLNFILLVTIVQVILNRSKILRLLMSYNYIAIRRIKIVWQMLHGNPIILWTTLLKGLWQK